ncbi:hypothetical protein TNCV_4699431 [Trichonephila clavipes]|nr:hypothetical protein TNCV_4699431 [Trichonephila clavipes]
MRVWMGSTQSSSWSTDLGINLGALAMMRSTLFCSLWRFSRWLFPAAPQMAQPWDEKMDGDCKAKLAAGTVGFEAGVSLFTDPISDVVKCI